MSRTPAIRSGLNRGELLVRAPLFAAMPRTAVDGLAARATRRRAKAGQRIGSDRVLIVLLTGRLEVVGASDAKTDGGAVIRSLVPPAVVGVSVAAGAPATAELVDLLLHLGVLRALADALEVGLDLALELEPDAAGAALERVLHDIAAELDACQPGAQRRGWDGGQDQATRTTPVIGGVQT